MINKVTQLLTAIGFVTLILFFVYPEKIIVKHTQLIPAKNPPPTITPQQKLTQLSLATLTRTPTIDSTPTTIPTVTPAPTIAHYEVNLSINGASSFSVSVPPDSNQCDVLTKALEQGKISNLNMRYDETYKTYGVYQINSIGKENSVWWVYEINKHQISQGCSYIKVSNGDNVEWKYLGS